MKKAAGLQRHIEKHITVHWLMWNAARTEVLD
jgi:hypothetical protein